jgi:hypothetical protein
MLLHSSWQGFTSDEPLTMRVVQYNHRKSHIHGSEAFVSLPKLKLLTEGADELNTRLLPIEFFVHSLFERQTTERKS